MKSHAQVFFQEPSFCTALGIELISEFHQRIAADYSLMMFRTIPKGCKDVSLLSRAMITVSGAGVVDVNGVYLYAPEDDNPCYFARTGSYKGDKNVRFTLYKYTYFKQISWFISFAIPGHSDVDVYRVMTTIDKQDDIFPPCENWQCCKLHAKAAQDSITPPTISC